ncbi:exonuclease [Tetragenococcus muriaticus PMC-11-5]|uniref:DNA polymerase III polC-type n=1 Tax=Tetragenococcus muriaticus PMC-11-5 TaxID=1302649 RepID=A0A091C260_9ENTE|nr:3'-5' exonuclease [Tetragenococcus muriaticus]KFN91896.1 exonuclease [Tetragenococcus muriaticus PMC-11-5]
MNFIAMDFETANAQRHSACSLALTKVENSQIVDEFYTLIKPETKFFWKNIQVHGIRPQDVADAPKFPEIWPIIQPYFQKNNLVVAHNASFDNSVLAGCLNYYNLEPANFLSLCTVKTSRKLYPEIDNHKLNTICKFLDIPLDNHHDALADSRACAHILLEEEKCFGTEPLKSLVIAK